MIQQDSGGPSPESFEPKADRDGEDISPDDGPTAIAHRDREVDTRPDPDATETERPEPEVGPADSEGPDSDADEVIDRATASVGHDDGTR